MNTLIPFKSKSSDNSNRKGSGRDATRSKNTTKQKQAANARIPFDMGNRKTKLKTEELADLMECTHFTQGEIEEWYKGFMKSCPDGLVSSADFQDMYSDFFEGDASEFASHVFRTFDSDKSGFIDFKEFMYSLSITSRGNLEEKLEWAFKIYDVDGDGYVTKREMEDIIRSVYKMYADSRLGRKETPEQRTARIFEKFDLNKDGKLTMEEFKTGARSDPFLVLMMQYKSLHGRKESDPSVSPEKTCS